MAAKTVMGTLCPRRHDDGGGRSKRYLSSKGYPGSCVTCAKEGSVRWQERNPNRVKEYRLRTRDRNLEYWREYAAKNKGKRLARYRKLMESEGYRRERVEKQKLRIERAEKPMKDLLGEDGFHCLKIALGPTSRMRTGYSSEKSRARLKRYAQSEKGKAANRRMNKTLVLRKTPEDLRDIRGRQFDTYSAIVMARKQLKRQDNGKDVRRPEYRPDHPLRAERHVQPNGDASGKAKAGQRRHGVPHKKHP